MKWFRDVTRHVPLSVALSFYSNKVTAKPNYRYNLSSSCSPYQDLSNDTRLFTCPKSFD